MMIFAARLLSRLPVTVLVLAFAAPVAFAQGYPTKPIRLVVPFGPGGSADAIARPLADKLGTVLGQSVVVDNRPGGLTVIGADLVAKSPPDGYTLYLMPGTHVLTPLMVQKVPYSPITDFTPIALLGSQPYMFVSNAQQPFSTFADLAGIWASHENKRQRDLGHQPFIEPGDVEAAMRTAAAIGDDTLQRRATGHVVPDSFTHGSAEQRQRWFQNGLREGTLSACDTFRAANLSYHFGEKANPSTCPLARHSSREGCV